MKIPEALYHYTVGPKLSLIAKSRHLAPTGYGLATSKKEKPVLWFSENCQWEPTATKVISTDGGKTFRRPEVRELQQFVGIYRFRLDTRNLEALNAAGIKLLPWTRLQTIARFDPRDINDMVTTGMTLGATPMHWWGVMEPVPVSLEVSGLLRLEICIHTGNDNPDTWDRISLADAITAWESRGLRVKQTTTSQTSMARGL